MNAYGSLIKKSVFILAERICEASPDTADLVVGTPAGLMSLTHTRGIVKFPCFYGRKQVNYDGIILDIVAVSILALCELCLETPPLYVTIINVIGVADVRGLW